MQSKTNTRQLLLLLLAMCLNISNFAQEIFEEENFTNAISNGWISESVISVPTDFDWITTNVGPQGPFPISPLSSNESQNIWAIFDSDLLRNDPIGHNSWFISPAYNGTGRTNVTLEFKTFYRSLNDRPQVRVGTELNFNDLESWATYEVFPGIQANQYGDGSNNETPQNNPQTITIDISDVADNAPVFYVAFQFLSVEGQTFNGGGDTYGWAYAWQVDDMKLISNPVLDVEYTDISCGASIDTSNVGAVNDFPEFPDCMGFQLGGPNFGDDVYRLEITDRQTVFINLETDPNSGQISYLLEDGTGNQPGECISYITSGINTFSYFVLDPGIYWIVVEGQEGPYTLSVDCEDRQIECGASFSSSTDFFSSRSNYSGCTTDPQNGKDALYWFELTEDVTIDLDITPLSSWEPDIFLLGNTPSNQPGSCITSGGDEDRIIENLPPGIYWVAVDSDFYDEFDPQLFHLKLDCYPGENNGTISCEEGFLVGSTIGAANTYDGNEGGCWFGNNQGGDRYYTFLITEPQTVVFNIKSLTEGAFFVTSIYDPGAGTCKGVGNDQIYAFLTPGNYVLIIDGATVADEGDFELTMNCYQDSGTNIIGCGTDIIGDSGGNFSTDTGFANACSNGDPFDSFPYQDRIYRLDLAETTDLIITIQSLSTAYLTVILLENNGNQPGNCIARGVNTFNENGQFSEIAEYLQAGTYWVIIDGLYGPSTFPPIINHGPFRLTVECIENYSEFTMSCGDVFTASTIEYISNFDGIDYFGCLGSFEAYPSADRFFEFEIAGEEKNLYLYLDNLTQKDLDLFLFSVDKQGNIVCLGSSTQSPGKDEAILFNANVGRYVAIVDGKDGEESIFELSLECFDMPTLCDMESVLIDAGNMVHSNEAIYGSLSDYIPPVHVEYIDCITAVYGDNLPRKGTVYTYYHEDNQNTFDLELNSVDNQVNAFVFNCGAPSTTDRSDLCEGVIGNNETGTISAVTGNFYYIFVANPNETFFTLEITAPTGPCSADNQIPIGTNGILPCSDPLGVCYSFEGQGNNFNSSDYESCLSPSDDLFTRSYEGEDMVFVIDFYSDITTAYTNVYRGMTIDVTTTGAAGVFLYNYECGETCIAYAEIPDGGGTGSVYLYNSPGDVLGGGGDDTGIYYLIVDQEDPTQDEFSIGVFPIAGSPVCFYDAVMDLRFVEGSAPGIDPNTELFIDYDRDNPDFDSVFHFVSKGLSWSQQSVQTPINIELEGYISDSQLPGEVWQKCGHDPGDSLVFRGVVPDGSIKIIQADFVDTTNNPIVNTLGTYQPDGVSLVRKLRVVGSEPAPALGVVPNVLESRKVTAAKSLQDTFEITVTANKRWRIIEGNNNGWYSFSPDRDDSPPYDQVVRFIAEENLSDETRSDTLILASLDTLEQIIIRQEPSPCFFNPLDPPVLETTADMLCPGQTITISTGGYVAYNWSTGETSEAIEISEPGTYIVEVTGTDGCSAVDSVIIEAFPEPQVEITGTLEICPGTSTTLSAGNFTEYNWSTGAATPSIEVNVPGIITVEVTDQNGCTAEDMVEVTEYNVTEVDLGFDQQFCFNTTVTLDAGNFQSYNWSTGAQGQTIEVSNTGTYSVEVTDQNGCASMDEITVTELAEVAVNITGDNDICADEITTLDAGSFESYDWSTGANSQTISVEAAGNYTVQVIDQNGCTGEDTFEVIEYDPIVFEISGDENFCFGESTTLDAGAFESYMWSNGEVTQTINVGMTGTYTVEVTDQNGCTETDEITVNELPELTIDLGEDISLCADESTTLNAGAYESYLWSTGEETQSINVTQTGTYSVEVTDINGCPAMDEIQVTVADQLLPQISGALSFCPGSSTILTVDSYDSYLWSTGEETQSITISQPGQYTVEVMDQNGCAGETSVAVIENEEINFEISGATGFCPDGSTTLDAGAGFETYNWSNGGDQQTIDVNQAGTYTVMVTNADGCEGMDEITVEEFDEVSVEITGETEICENNSSILSVGLFESYLWSTGEETQNISVDQAGIYTVEVMDQNGCAGATEIEIVVNALPDPTISGNLTICSDESTLLSTGNFESYLWSTGEETQSIEVSNPGTYTVEVTNQSGCTNTAEVVVESFDAINLEISGDQAFCFGESTQLSVDQFETYLWSTGEETQSISVTASGTYTVEVMDQNGCTAEAEIIVEQLAEVSVSILGENTFCFDESTELSTGDFESYLWSTGEETQTITVSEPGTYTLAVIDQNACPGATEIIVEELPEIQVEIVGETTFCFEESTELSTGSFESYLWSTGEETQSISVSESGTYTLEVMDQNGCSNSTEIAVEELPEIQVEISGETAFCFDESTTLSTGTFESYLWSTGEETQSISISAPGTYTVEVTDQNACSNSAEVTVEQYEEIQVDITGENTFCFDESTALATGNFESYLWSTGEETQNIIVSETGTYSVEVTDQNGCSNNASITVEELDSVEVQIMGSLSFCEGTSTILDAGEYASYVWTNFEETQTIEVDVPGTYQVVVTTNDGCEGIGSVEVEENESLTPQITGTPGFCEGESTTLDVGAFETYLWSTGEETQNITVIEAGNYTVDVTDINGCSGTDEIMVEAYPEVQVDISGETTFCFEESTLLSTGDFESYLWSTDEETQTITVSEPGTYSVAVIDQNGCPGATEIIVEELSEIQVEIAGETTFCFEESTELSTGDFESYLWSTGEETQSITASEPGAYTVEVTDINGCSNTAEITIEAFEEIQVDISGNNTFCFEESTELSTGDFETYLWSTGEETQTITVSEPGTYSVEVTDQNGCSNTAEITIEAFEEIQVDISGNNTFCFEESTELSTGDFETYLWSTGEETQTITVSEPGTYSVEVTDQNGCSNAAEITVEEFDEIQVDISGNNTFCFEESTELSTGDFETYLWSTGEETQTITVSEPGTYSVEVTDQNGCSNAAEITIEELPEVQVDISGATTFCTGTSTELSVGTFEAYLWSTGEETQTITVSEPGTYSVEVTDQNGCSNAAEITVEEFDEIQVDISGNNTFCFEESTELTSGDFASYLWSTGEETQSITVTEPGIYSLQVVDQNGCPGMDEIVVEELPAIMVEISGETTFCFGESTELDAGDFESYFWSTGEETQSITVAEPGTYTVEVTDQNGCAASNEIELTQFEAIQVEISGETTFCFDESTALSTGDFASYLWSTGEETQSISVTESGTYTVEVTDQNGCSNVAELAVQELAEINIEILGDPVFCFEGSTEISVEGFETYLWSTGEMTSSIEVDEAGEYSVMVSDENACTAEQSIIIEALPELAVDIQGNDFFCFNESTTLSIEDDYETILWSTGSTLPSITVGIENTYSVAVTDENGCVGVSTIDVERIPEIIPQIDGVLSICEEGSTTLSTSGYAEYLWSTGESGPEITVDTPGEYTVSVTDENGCTGEQTVTIEENPGIEFEIEGDDFICPNESTILDAGDFESYLWSTGEVSRQISANAAGTYTVMVTDENGCTGEQSIEIVEVPGVSIGFDDLSHVTCFGDMDGYIDISASGGTGDLIIEWNDNLGDSDLLENLGPGAYTVVVSDENRCTATATFSINEPDPIEIEFESTGVSSMSANDGIATANPTGGTPPYTYLWDTGATTQTIAGLAQGIYTVTVTDIRGCEMVAEVEIDLSTSAREIALIQENLRVFPNPTREKLYIQYRATTDKQFSFELLDLLGRKMSKGEINVRDKIYTVDVQDLPKAIYFLKFTVDGMSFSQKIVIN